MLLGRLKRFDYFNLCVPNIHFKRQLLSMINYIFNIDLHYTLPISPSGCICSFWNYIKFVCKWPNSSVHHFICISLIVHAIFSMFWNPGIIHFCGYELCWHTGVKKCEDILHSTIVVMFYAQQRMYGISFCETHWSCSRNILYHV